MNRNRVAEFVRIPPSGRKTRHADQQNSHEFCYRRGASLIELVVMMGILSVVMTLVGKTMVLTMRSERKGRNAIVSANGLTRLANRFRRDVHAAENAELVGDGDAKLLRLTGVDGTIVEYRPEAGGVKLTVRRDQKQTARESYRLQGATRFEITANPRPVVTLIHVPDHGRIAGSNAAAKNDKQIRVEALRGYDLRFQVGVQASACPVVRATAIDRTTGSLKAELQPTRFH
jgi:hypothetical protein